MIFIITTFLFISVFHDSYSISDDLKKEFLEAHNNYRRQVAKGQISGHPSAGDMMEMVWNIIILFYENPCY